MVIKAATVTFDAINIGDDLPSIQKSETQEQMDNYLVLNQRPEREIPSLNLHTDQEFADQGIFTGTVNYGVVTCAFMTELLQLAFPTKNITQGAFSMRALEPIRVNDVVTYTGKVTNKRVEGAKRLVDVEATGTNQLGQTVAVAKATIPL
jgi:hypothetical protein